MVLLKGVQKLPIKLTDLEAIAIYKKLSSVNVNVGRLSTSFENSIVNSSILSLLSYNESVQSTRIEEHKQHLAK